MQDFLQVQRVYKYIIFQSTKLDHQLKKNRGWHIIKKLDINLMKKGAKKLLRY